MEKMKHYLLIHFILLLVLFGLSCSQKGYKKEYKLTLNVPATFYWGQGAAKFAELVKQKTNGQINVKPYYNSTLLKGAQLKSPQMVASGVIDCAFESTINLSTVIPEVNIFSLPFFINTFDRLDKLEQGACGKALFEAMEEKGLKGLVWGENGFRQVTNSKRELAEPEDFKGLRIRVVGSPIFIDIFRALGADPVNMNWGDAVTAFQQGVVDGQENPMGVLIPVQIHQYHKYITLWNYLADPLIIYWNKKQWDGFPADIRLALQEAAREAARFQKALSRAGLDESSLDMLATEFGHTMPVPDPIAFLKEKGMQVTGLFEDTIELFRLETKPVYDAWIPKVGEELYKLALADMGDGDRTMTARDPKYRETKGREAKPRTGEERRPRQ